MKNTYSNSKSISKSSLLIATFLMLLCNITSLYGQVRVPFTQRTSVYSPNKKIYNIKGDFTMIGNTNLTLVNYGDNNGNNNQMQYVDIDGDSNTFNSSSANLTLSLENGAVPSCSNIVYAGLYWTGRSSDSNPSNNVFTVTKNNVTKTFNKRVISLKGPQSATYTQFTAAPTDIYYPTTNDGFMYSAQVEVTDYVRANGVGNYFAADIALVEGSGGGTGYYGGWGLIVVYENSKMKWRDVTIFDGHSYVAGGVTADFEIPVSGFNTAQAGAINMKLGLMAGEGDRNIAGDFFQIRNYTDTNWITLNHAGNSTTNFFNSSIFTGGNTRNPNLLNNTGLDISMFNIPNNGNSIITNGQTSTKFRYGTTQDTFIIFGIAMSVDAYVPDDEGVLVATAINNVPITNPTYTTLPGDEVSFNLGVKNLGTEAINNYKIVIPIPFNATYVPGSAVGTPLFSPLPTPNNVFFDATLGATGSIVWDFGTLPLPANPDTLLATLTFKLKTTTDCAILRNLACGDKVNLNGYTYGFGAVTNIPVASSPFIQGYQQNGNCIGEPIPQPLAIKINGTDYVNQNCLNQPLVRNFSYCTSSTTVAVSEIASNFPLGSTFYNEFPITPTSIQYTATTPFPISSGTTTTFHAIPPFTTNCSFPFTLTKCGVIVANNDTGVSVNGFTGGTSFTNVLVNDTLNGNPVVASQVNTTFVSSTNPGVTLSGTNVVVAPG
ncbi:hypothetical protein, partial [Flavobacterium sp.]|uniref:hypothetical protein n=1 Tax=Flavobacterium sp. TaxID=239 RepID=UPI0025C134FB